MRDTILDGVEKLRLDKGYALFVTSTGYIRGSIGRFVDAAPSQRAFARRR